MSNEDITFETEEEESVKTSFVKCPGCGANMKFDPEYQTLVCEHCGSRIDFANDNVAKEIDLYAGLNGDCNWDKSKTSAFKCTNCGARIVLNSLEVSKTCPFCGTAHTQEIEEFEGLKPTAVLPFGFSIDKGIEFFKKWAKKKLFAPRAYKMKASAENVKGVYVPGFTFDSSTTSVYVGRVGTTHTRVVGSGKNRRTETYVVWRNISGTYTENFDDILITAGSKFDQQKLDKLSPFNTNASKDFEENYMLGFSAYQYDHEFNDCWANAKGIMDSALRRHILAQYHYDRLDYLNVSTTHENVKYKYVMLPVYVGNSRFKKKLYNFYVNGCSGKVTGKSPKSILKILLAVLIGCGIIGVIIFLLIYFGVF